MPNIQKIIHKNISFFFDEQNITLKDIQYNNEILLNTISFNDEFKNKITELSEDYSYIPFVQNILKSINWKIEYKVTKKEVIIFLNGKHIFEKILNINITIIVQNFSLKIQHIINSNNKLFFGLKTNLHSPFIFNVNNLFLVDKHLRINEEEKILIKGKEETCCVTSTYPSLTSLSKKHLMLSPLLQGSHKEIFKSWRTKWNNKNFNVILLSFK